MAPASAAGMSYSHRLGRERRFARAAAALLFLAAGLACWSRLPRSGPGRRVYTAFLQPAEWPNATFLGREDTLPLTADAVLDVGVQYDRAHGLSVAAKPTTRASYLADFGFVDLPVLGEMRARAGVRYSRLYPMGALELAFRKEWRLDYQRGYNLFIGGQSAGDDKRLDTLLEIGLLKIFRNAKAFYRFQLGNGFAGGDSGWSEMGSSLGVTHIDLPPLKRGELTVGWRTRLFNRGPEDLPAPRRRFSNKQESPLESTPYVAYSIDVPCPAPLLGARVSSAIMPKHDLIEHTACFTIPAGDDATSETSVTATVEQSIQDPLRGRLRVSASYTKG